MEDRRFEKQENVFRNPDRFNRQRGRVAQVRQSVTRLGLVRATSPIWIGHLRCRQVGGFDARGIR